MTEEHGLKYLEKIENAASVTTKLNLYRQLIRETGYDPKIVESAVHSICLLHPEYNDRNKILLVLSEEDTGGPINKFTDQIRMKFPENEIIDVRSYKDNGYFEVDEGEYNGIFLSTGLRSCEIDYIMDSFEDETFYLISERNVFDVK